ncbi:MAG: response regulator transcription factor [Lachnospiraceae bacterium]|jgi:two-component system response regulator YesN
MSEYTAVICDDESSIVDELTHAVRWEELGISIVGSASGGREALDLILNKRPDIVIMDIRMPDLSGLEVMKAVREAKLTTEFIILSGYDEFNYAKEAIRFGAKAYLLKPLNLNELYDELYDICTQSAGRQRPNAAYLKKITENFLRNLISGHITSQESLTSRLSGSGSFLHDGKSYCICLSWEEPILRNGATSARILHAIDTCSLKDPHVFLVYTDSQIAGVCNSGAGDPLGDCIRIQGKLADESIPTPLIGIGDPVESLLQVPYSYNRALTAMTYQIYNNRQNVFPWTVICATPPARKFTDIDCLSLVQCIVKGDRKGIQNACKDFLNELMYVPMPAPNYLLGGCYSLCQRIDREFAEWTQSDIQGLSAPRELYSLRSIDTITGWLIQRFTYLSEYIDAVYGYGRQKSGSETSGLSSSEKSAKDGLPVRTDDPVKCDDEIVRKAASWIQSHILDNPRIEDVAREVHLSSSYFAIYFKKKTGINLRDYMLREKMEYARIALLKPETQVGELALTLGYNDYRSFSRAFKNITGLTPSDFQAKYRH